MGLRVLGFFIQLQDIFRGQADVGLGSHNSENNELSLKVARRTFSTALIEPLFNPASPL